MNAIRNADGSFQPAGMMTTIGTVIRSSTGHKSPFVERRMIIPSEDPFQTSWIIGAAMLVRSELFRRIGGFDPRFFLYFEETDLCRRITQQGAGIWAVGKAVAVHIGGHSAKATQQPLISNCMSEHFFRSRFYYLVKHFGWTKAVTADAITLTLDLMRLLKYWITQQPSELIRARTFRPFLKLPQFPRDSG